MTNSPEYPDLPFDGRVAHGSGRDGYAVRYIVVHYTAGSETRTSAEDGAAYDRRRTDGVSTHYFVDQDSVFQEVLTTDRANAAFGRGNRLGIQYELCGTAQSRANWLDAASDATLTNAARQMARDAVRYGLPVRRLSVAEVRDAWDRFPAGPKGFCGHGDVTLAYGQGDHMDPGPEFPWDVLLSRVQQFVNGAGPSSQGGSDMSEWHVGEGTGSALTQGPKTPKMDKAWLPDSISGQQRDTGLAHAWHAAARAALAVEHETLGLAELHAKVDALAAGGISQEALVAALVAALGDQGVRALLTAAAREGASLAEDS